MKILSKKIIIFISVVLFSFVMIYGVQSKEIREYGLLPVKASSYFSSSEFDLEEYIKSCFDIIGEVHYVDKKYNTIVVDDTEFRLNEKLSLNLNQGDYAGVKIGENGKVVSIKKLSRKY